MANTKQTQRGGRINRSPYYRISATTRSHKTVSKEDNEHLLNLWRQGATLRPSQQTYIWKWFDDFCLRCVAKQFRVSEGKARADIEWHGKNSNSTIRSKRDIHTDRIVMCMSFFKEHNDKGIGWLMFAYRVRFALFETKRYLEGLGIYEIGNVQSVVNKRYQRLLQIVRENYSNMSEVTAEDLTRMYKEKYPDTSELVMELVAEQATRLSNALVVYYPHKSLDYVTNPK